MGTPGLGYGAGGGVGDVIIINIKNETSSTTHAIQGVPGKCGNMAMGIFDLNLNQSISCTVGTSVKPTLNANTILQHIKKSIPSVTEISDNNLLTDTINSVTAGTAGVVYIEFLG